MEMGLQSKEVRIPKIQNSIQKNLRIDHTKSDGGDEFKSNYAKEVARCWDASSSSEDDFPQVNGTPNIIGTVEIHNQNELEQPFIIGERRTELNRVGHHHRTNSVSSLSIIITLDFNYKPNSHKIQILLNTKKTVQMKIL